MRHKARAWRQMASVTIFLTACLIVTVWFGMVFLPVMFALSVPIIAFLCGYLMRADEAATGRGPYLPFLHVDVDDDERA